MNPNPPPPPTGDDPNRFSASRLLLSLSSVEGALAELKLACPAPELLR